MSPGHHHACVITYHVIMTVYVSSVNTFSYKRLSFLDVGTRPKVMWLFVVFHKKTGNKKKTFDQLTFMGKVMFF
jgi:hypothetical protein